MEKLLQVDWAGLFIPTHSVAEMVVRGTLMYLALFLILRFLMKRQGGSIGIADLLVIIIIADAAQNAFAKEYSSVTEGVVLVLTIIFWDFLHRLAQLPLSDAASLPAGSAGTADSQRENPTQEPPPGTDDG